MENYPGNSYKSKEESITTTPEKRASKVTTGTVKTRKKTTSGIIFEQDFRDIKDNIIKNTVVPSIKNMVSEFIDIGLNTVRETINSMIFKDGSYGRNDGYYNYSRTNRPRTMQDRYSYASSYNANLRPRNEPQPMQSMASANSYDDLIFNTKDDAEAVIQQLLEIVEQYGYARVADMYEAAGVTTTNWAYNDYGWRDLSSAYVARTRDGYTVRLPKASPLN